MAVLICGCIILLLIIILAANERYKGTNYFKDCLIRENRLVSADAIPEKLDIINTGSADARFAFDYTNIEKRGFNFAQSPQSLGYDYRILQQYACRFNQGCKVLIPLGPFVFLFEDYQKDLYNAKYYGLLDKEKILRYHKLKGWLYNAIPIIFSGRNALHIFHDSKKKDYLEQEDSGFTCEMAASMAEKQIHGWMKEFGLRDCIDGEIPEDRKQFLKLMSNKLDEMVEFCVCHHWEVILVATPFSSALNVRLGETFMDKIYYSVIKQQVDKGIRFLDYRKASEFQEHYEWFLNGTNWLSGKGRRCFMEILLQDIG